MSIFPSIYRVYNHRTKTETDTEYYIHLKMAFTPSIAILFLLVVASSIAAGSNQSSSVVVHEGLSTLIYMNDYFY